MLQDAGMDISSMVTISVHPEKPTVDEFDQPVFVLNYPKTIQTVLYVERIRKMISNMFVPTCWHPKAMGKLSVGAERETDYDTLEECYRTCWT